MSANSFTEGVKPGGLTTSTEIRILVCYLLDSVGSPVTRQQLEDVLVGEELANYFVLAESLSQLEEQGLVTKGRGGYRVSDAGRTVGHNLAHDVPRTVRDAAVRGVIRAQQYAAKAASNKSEIIKDPESSKRTVSCSIDDDVGSLFRLDLYMPDELTAEAVRDKFIESGDEVYKLVLAALTGNTTLAEKALDALGPPSE